MQFNIQRIDTESDSDYAAFDDFLSTGEIKKCLTADVWLTCPPDVVWEEAIDLLMKSALLLSEAVCDIEEDTCLSALMANLLCNVMLVMLIKETLIHIRHFHYTGLVCFGKNLER